MGKTKLLGLFLIGIFCVATFASALTWKDYNAEDKIVTIIGDKGKNLVELQLISPLNTLVSAGTDVKVAEFLLIDYTKDTKLFDIIETYDDKDKTKTSKLNKEFTLKYANEYIEYACSLDYVNESSCWETPRTDWVEFTTLKNLPRKNIRIALFTDTILGEKIEWVPIINGFSIDEWATYTVTATGWVTDATKLNQNSGNYYYDGYLYGLGLGTDYLTVYDVTGGAGDPTYVGSYTSGSGDDSIDSPNSIFVNGDYAYVMSNTDNNVVIFDISAHTNPVYIGNYTGVFGGGTYVMTDTNGDYMYAVGNNGNVIVIDISDKANPVAVGNLQIASGDYSMANSKSLFYMKGYLYVTSWASDRLVVLDVLSNSTPTTAGFVTSDTGTNSLDAVYFAYGEEYDDNELIYTISWQDGNVAVWNVSAHGNPVHLGGYGDLSGEYSMSGARQIFASNGYAYVSAFTPSGLTVLNCTNITLGGENPEPIGWYTDTAPPYSIEWSLALHGGDGYIYVGSYQDNGMTQFNFTDLFPAPGPTDTCTYTDGNWFVSCNDNCSITSDVDLGGNNITINGTGIFDIAANITNYGYGLAIGENSTNICTITCRAGGCLGF